MTRFKTDHGRFLLPVLGLALALIALGGLGGHTWLSLLGIAVLVAFMALSPAPANHDRQHARMQQAIRRSREIRHQRMASGQAAAVPPGRRNGTAAAIQQHPRRVVAAFAETATEYRLHPILPAHTAGTRHTSWIGGRPSLPADTPWPHIAGKPAQFLAQIDCAALPANLRPENGSATGTLSVFRAQGHGHATRAVVLFSDRPGRLRQPPQPLHCAGMVPARTDILERATGRICEIPRWPVAIVSATSDTGANRRDATPLDPDDCRLDPFDWDSAMILLEVLHSELAWQNRVISTLSEGSEADPERSAFLLSLSDVLSGTVALRHELACARDRNLPFDRRLQGLLMRGLASLGGRSGPGRSGAEHGTIPTPIDRKVIRREYVRWVEQYAKQLYCSTPEALPEPQRQLFESRWSGMARSDAPTISAALPENVLPFGTGASSSNQPVLSLPGNRLLGWDFGGTDLRIALDMERMLFSGKRG